MKQKLKFRFRKETPGAYRFEEIDDAGEFLPLKKALVGTLYLRKEHAGEINSDNILRVTVST